MSDHGSDLTQGRVSHQVLRVSAPMAMGILGVLAVGLSDAYFLARVGDAELAAIGFVYPVIVAISAFAIGMSAGANTALSQAMGRGSGARPVARLALHATGFGLLLGAAVGLTFLAASPVLFPLLGAEGTVQERVMAYVPWWAASFPVLVTTMILNAAFRAGGDGATPSSIMVLSAALNIALTPALVFGLGPVEPMGMAGAGISTLAARSVGGVLALTLAIRRGRLTAGAHPLRGVLASVREIVSVGLPAAASRAVNPAGMALVTAAVATLGDAAVGGFGAAARVQSIALVPFFALSSGLAPVIGQAWGAGRRDRAREAVRLGGGFAIVYGVAVGVFLWAFADPLAEAMTASGAAARYTADYMRIVGWSLAGYGIVVATNAALTARSRSGWALGLSLSRIGLIYVPLAWFGVGLMGYSGILLAAVAANVLAAWAAAIAAQANGLLQGRTAAVASPARSLAAWSGSRDG
ncbi:MATE family efflux transporter [Roseibacterium sp. SDUM158017]|uniref:MATE family efflux transporter n=1 Tax=Roseicyclus salinarum TaxID=3036773 RepID=UPI002414ECC0|nr:MATE family efflux transporter [Roseibacterium sp. SDUM158017]MDG4650510.1 MATE family efflux transporter [Roseibacterium sp. SDUM158017]